MLIKNNKSLGAAIDHFYGSNRGFILEFENAGGRIDETVLSRQITGSRGLSSAWLSAYNLFFIPLLREELRERLGDNSEYIFDTTESEVMFSTDNSGLMSYVKKEYPGRETQGVFFFDFSTG